MVAISKPNEWRDSDRALRWFESIVAINKKIMTKESLKRANELTPLINECKGALQRWKDIYRLKDIMEGNFRGESSNKSYLPTKHIPLDVLKVLVIDKYVAELKELEREFDSL